MKVFLPLCVLLATALATPFHMDFEPLSDAHISYINKMANNTWKAGRDFFSHELERVKGMLGVDIEKNDAYNRFSLHHEALVHINRFQAFGAAEAMTDRICIKSGGKQKVHISAEDINDCCHECGYGCNGGLPAKAWKWYVETGVVSGGEYNTSQGCMPYSLPHCDHFSSGKYSPCEPNAQTPKCKKKCRKGYSTSYRQDKRKGKTSYGVKGVQQIMQELVDNGPVTSIFAVYEDFLSYKSGVYRYTSGLFLGGHAIKIIGYGTENGDDYWLVANSWNTDWGDKGFFKILKGSNECLIEGGVVTGEPDLST